MSDKQHPDLNDYINLTQDIDLSGYVIKPNGFDCDIISPEGTVHKGFLLAKSPSALAMTLCDVSFQWSDQDRKYAPRLTFRRTNKDLEDKPINKGSRFQRIPFENGSDGYREFWQVIGFLATFKEIVDLGAHFSAYKMVSKDSVVEDLKAKQVDERMREIVSYATESGLTLEDMAGAMTHKTRADDLIEFKKLIDDAGGYRISYRSMHASEISKPGDEALFHHFLKSHKWIFGLSLDLKFIEEFADEASVGISDTANHGNAQADMLGWTDYTALVELKTPDANFFTTKRSSTARTNTWSFTSEFIDGYSQVLAQKDDWSVNHSNKKLIQDKDGVKEVMDQNLIRTVDPRAIFVYGNKREELPPGSSDNDILVKRDTLERYLRDHRNVMVISFDELYERAYHIVHSTEETAPEPSDDL